MKRYLVAASLLLLAVFPNGIASAGTIGNSNGKTTGIDKANADCLLPDLRGAGGAAVPSRQAVGIVTRETDTEDRVVVKPVDGEFIPGAQVKIYTRDGEYFSRGTVHSVYEDDLYVDISKPAGFAKESAEPGFRVLMNIPSADAPGRIRALESDLKTAESDASAEASRIQREVAAEEKSELATREKWQQEMTTLRIQKSYEYPYYYGYGRWGYPY